MVDNQLNVYKKEKRRENRTKVREALFIREYVFYKYFNVHEEAAQMYNHLNKLYPNKPDLRRCKQFKEWSQHVVGKNSKPRMYPLRSYQNIPVSTCVDPNASFVVRSESPQPERPSVIDGKTMELRIPLLRPPDKTQKPPATETLETDKIQKPPATETLETDKIQKPPATETLETLTEEVVQEGSIDSIQPSLYEEISPEIIDKIIAELRGDSGLKDIVTAVEEEIELEEIGMDIDIDVEIDDRLETELENICW